MKIVFYFTLIVNLILLGIYAFLLPDNVVQQFDFNGKGGGGAPKIQFLVVAAITVGFTCGLFTLFGLFPASWFNVPNDRFWKKEENIGKIKEMIAPFWWELGFTTSVLIGYALYSVVCANLRNPPQMGQDFFWALVAYGLSLVLWLIRLYLAFRIPKQTEDVGQQTPDGR